jgi:hypothetical protein
VHNEEEPHGGDDARLEDAVQSDKEVEEEHGEAAAQLPDVVRHGEHKHLG